MLAAGDFCRATLVECPENEAYPEVILAWANKEYRLVRGKMTIVPFEAMCNRLGDPRSGSKILPIREPGGETTGWIPDRKAEVARLRLLWGAHADNYPRFDDISVPKIVITDLDSEPVYTVVDDPEGKASEPVTQTADDRDALLAMLDRQQQQIDKMRTDLGMEPDIAAEDQLPSDDEHEPMFVGTGSNQ